MSDEKITLSERISTAGANAVAAACGCGKTQVYEWCHGRAVETRYRAALCETLGISDDHLRELSAEVRA